MDHLRFDVICTQTSNDPFRLETKPHGHGDVHLYLYKEGIIDK
jgi:UDP-N-acetylglucosamine pyrophosphorylase